MANQNNQPGHPFLYGLHNNETFQENHAYLSPNDSPSTHRSYRPTGGSSSWSYMSDDRYSWQHIPRSSATDAHIGTPSINSDKPPHRRLFCPICQKEYQGYATLANHLNHHRNVLMCVECSEDGYRLQDYPVVLWACGFCITGQLYKSKDNLHKHIAKDHGGGDVSPGWDISFVIRNYLGHESLQGHFQQWLRRTYPHLSSDPPTLIWRRSSHTHKILRCLQAYRLENISHEDAWTLVHQICNLKSYAYDGRLVRENLTPSTVGELTYGVGQSLPHPQATNPIEAEEELPTTEPSIALSQYYPRFSSHPSYVQDLDVLPPTSVPTQQYVGPLEPTNGLHSWPHANVYLPIFETDETTTSANPFSMI